LTRAPQRLKLEEWNSTYPGLVDALVRHPGIGLVMAYNDADEAIAFGKDGAHNVHTGAVVGTDPLALYGEPTLRAAQLKRIADFPNNGDLTIISTFYPDGTVAAMEELVGNHGGLGGEQTDAFLFHPPTFQVPPTSNSADVFQILDARRGLVVEPREPKRVRQTEAWSPRALWLGLVRVRKWVPVAARAVVLDRWAFRQAAYDPYMTGPALLITGVTTLLLTLVARGGFDAAEWGTRLGSWFVSVVIALGAARLVGGKSDFTTTLRAVGFAQTAFLLEGLTVIPLLAGIAGASAFVLAFLGTWIGVTEAHKLHGWRTLLFPVLMFALGFVGVALLDILLRGTELSLFEVGRALGIVPR
jgi:hypothetical protein